LGQALDHKHGTTSHRDYNDREIPQRNTQEQARDDAFRQQWQKGFPGDPIPRHEDPPYDRDGGAGSILRRGRRNSTYRPAITILDFV
jgi:hypothetical protein